ncbi:MAG: SRPBCC family protein [Gaiellaceae bacterium]
MRYESSIEIERSPDEVFTFLTDLRNLPAWQPSVVATRAEGTLAPGGTFSETREFLGKRIESTLEVVALEPGRELTLRVVEGPVPLTIRHLLEEVGTGTRLTLTGEGEPGGLFRLAAPLAGRAVKRQAGEDLRRLKRLLEERL